MSGMYKLCLVNQKGGVGKTTSSVQIAAGLAESGLRVLACDMDAQANFTKTMRGDDGVAERDGDPTMFDVLAGTADAAGAIIEIERGGLLPASTLHKKLSLIDAVIGDRPDKLFRLSEALEAVDEKYDVAVIDTPPSRDTLMNNALTAADSIIIPTEAGEYSLDGIADLSESIVQVRKYTNPNLKILGVLVTKYQGRTNVESASKADALEIAEQLGTRLFETPIRSTVKIGETQKLKTDIFAYAPSSGVAGDYMDLCREIIKEVRCGR